MEGRDQPNDYQEKIAEGYTKNWIDSFHTNNYQKLILDNKDMHWLKQAFKIGTITCNFPSLFQE